MGNTLDDRFPELSANAYLYAAPTPMHDTQADRADEVPTGYKRTEAGVIPFEWDVMTIGDLFESTAGGDFDPHRSSDVQSDSHPYPIYANGLSHEGLYGFCDYTENRPGSITITARGTLGVALFRDTSFVAIGRLLVLKPKIRMDARYFSNFINHGVRFAVESTGVPQLTAPQVARYVVPVPPEPEQRAIAEALSDVDELLAALDVLIAKKRNVKQAVMQQLLTGKTRLPGFSGKWIKKLLGDVSHIKTGSRNNQDKVNGGMYPFFVRSATVEQIDSYAFEGEAILVPGEGDIGGVFHYIDGRFDVHQRVYQISRFSEDVCGKYLYYCMVLYFGAHATQNTVKAAVDSLRLPTFKNFVLSLPSDVAEQRAVATILSDLDTGLATLERYQDKTRDIKQSMMQQLLTGRVRLSTCPNSGRTTQCPL